MIYIVSKESEFCRDLFLYDFDGTIAVDTKVSSILLKLCQPFKSFPLVFAAINFVRTICMLPSKHSPRNKWHLLTSRHKYDHISVRLFLCLWGIECPISYSFRDDVNIPEKHYKLNYLSKINGSWSYYEDNKDVVDFISLKLPNSRVSCES